MRLSSQKDLLLIIIISLAVLTINWLHLLKGSTLTFLQYIVILLVPGYALITAVWPTNEKINWNMRLGIGFIMGLLSVLFLPLILESLNLKFITNNLTNLLLIAAIILSLLAIARRSGLGEEPHEKGSQLTLEELIQKIRAKEQKAENSEFVDYEYKKEPSEVTKEDYTDIIKEDVEDYKEEPDKYSYLKEEKPIQYARVHRKDYTNIKQNSTHLYVNNLVKTDPSLTEYEAVMYKPVWMDEFLEKESPFKSWDILFIFIISSISLLVLYFNPQNVSTSLIFFVLSLFVLGYASLTIIFPDKSRATLRNLIITSGIIAIILFFLSFMAGAMHLLPFTPRYVVEILVVASIILLAGAFLRKWQITEERFKNDVTREKSLIDKYEEDEKYLKPEKKVEKKISSPSALQEKKDQLKTSEEPNRPIGSENITGDPIIKKPPIKGDKSLFPTDILLIIILTILTTTFVLIPPLNETIIRSILGILMVLFIPGYSLIAALFPKKGDLESIERVALSFGLSIAVTPLIGLALNYTPWGIRLDPILICLTVFTIGMCFIAFIRRRKLPEEDKYSVPFRDFLDWVKGSFTGKSRTERILSIILIISIILAISTTVYIIVKPKEGEKFTEFYILGPDGKASNYPTNLTQGQFGSVIIGVVNHEYTTKNYQVVVMVNGTTLKNDTITLTNNQKMEIPFNFTAGTLGQKKMEFLLYKLPDQESTYRSLHLWMNITG